MIKVIVALLTLSTATSFGAQYTFNYNNKLIVEVNAENSSIAFKKSAIICFNTLTGGVYPGEEKGLNIIDLCANPLNFKL